MPTTIRDQIIDAFCVKVGAERCSVLDSSSDLPAKSVWDNREESSKSKYGSNDCVLALPVEYLAKVDKVTYASVSKQANAMLGDVIQSATSGDNTLGGLCKSINYIESEITYPQDGQDEIEIYVVFNVLYSFLNGDPFSAA